MKICAISDLHGNLPIVEPCDLLIISGDICIDFGPPKERTVFGRKVVARAEVGSNDAVQEQADWLDGPFRKWLDNVPAKEVVACWGNHDFIGQRGDHLIPELRWHMLTEETKTILGLKIYGNPYQPWYYDWSYNLPRGIAGDLVMAEKLNKVEEGTDIMIVHGPPRGYGDVAPDGTPTGSIPLTETIFRIKPKLTVHGHIHCGRGEWRIGETIVCNASILDEAYEMVHKPFYFDLD